MEEELTELEEVYQNKFHRTDDYIFEIYYSTHTLVVYLTEKYPEEPPTFEVYKKDKYEEDLTNLIQIESLKYKGEHMMEILIEFLSDNLPILKPKTNKKKNLSKSEVKKLEKEKEIAEREKREQEEKEELARKSREAKLSLAQLKYEEKMRKRKEKEEKEIKKATVEPKVQVDPSVLGWTNYSKLKKTPKVVKTQDEIDALAVSSISGTVLDLVKNLNKTGLEKEEKSLVLSSLKTLASRSLNIDYKSSLSDMRAHIDCMKVIVYYGSNSLKEDPFAIEILIYASFIVCQYLNIPEVIIDIFRLGAYEFLWGLAKRKTKQIRQHMNKIIEKLSVMKTLSRDIIKALNKPDYSDFRFICYDGTEYFAHKCILQVRTTGIDLSLDSLTLPKEIESIAVLKFLEFIYGNSIFFSIEELKENLPANLYKKGLEKLKIYCSDATYMSLLIGGTLKSKTVLQHERVYSSDILRILESKNNFSDVKFSMVKNPDQEEINMIEIPVNKIILSIRSEFFDNMFKSGLSETNLDVIPMDFSYKVMKPILNSIYSDSVNYLTTQNVIETLIASDLYMIHSLKSSCQEMLAKMIDISNYEVLNDIAHDYNCELLEEALYDFIKQHNLNQQ